MVSRQSDAGVLWSMASVPVAQQVVRTVGGSRVAERVATAQERLYGPLLDWIRQSPFRTGALGHSVHPPLTDVTIGCWLSASVLDLLGGDEARHGAQVLVGAGLVASVPTAMAGAADWATLAGSARRIGAVHALGTDAATFLLVGSLAARLRGRHGVGTGFAVAGNLVLAGAGLLGGHLALSRGTARREVST